MCTYRGSREDQMHRRLWEISQVQYIAKIVDVTLAMRNAKYLPSRQYRSRWKFFRGSTLSEWWLEGSRKTKTRSCSGRRPTSIPTLRRGDVILVLQEQHSVFNRNELFLVEELCGLELGITQVTTSLGAIVQPMMQEIDPSENDGVVRSRPASSSL